MGLTNRFFGRPDRSDALAEEILADSGVLDDVGFEQLVEVAVTAGAYFQEARAQIAGPKDSEPKRVRVGVTLRSEPTNEFDANAVRVETMGQVLGYLPAVDAEAASFALAILGGAVEAHGVIVGGWVDPPDDREYGLRVWLPTRLASQLGYEVPRRTRALPRLPHPSPDEVRLSAPDLRDWYTPSVVLTGEQHYQEAILESCPDDEGREWWNFIVTLGVGVNPNSQSEDQVVEAKINGRTVGFLTRKMSARFLPQIVSALDRGLVPTAVGYTSQRTVRGDLIWRVELALAPPPPSNSS